MKAKILGFTAVLAAFVSLLGGCPSGGGAGLAAIAPATSGTQVELAGTNLVLLLPEGGRSFSGSSTSGGKTTLNWRLEVNDNVFMFVTDEGRDLAGQRETYKSIADSIERTYYADESDLIEWSWVAKDDPKKTRYYGFDLNVKVGSRVIGFSPPNDNYSSREAAERAISYARTLRAK